MTREKNKLVMPNFIEQMKKAHKWLRCSVSSYTSKGWNPVILYHWYQKSWDTQERVATLYDYGTLGQVFKDLIHNVWYTNSEKLV